MEHRGDSDKTNQRSYWNTEVILINKSEELLKHRGDSDKTNQRCYWNTGVILIKQIREVIGTQG